MSAHTWLLFCVTETVLCFTPGPAVLLVISMSLTRDARAGLATSLGILLANTAYFAVSATSLGAVLVASWKLFFLVKWLGAAYLVWLGGRMLLRPSAQRPPSSAPQSSVRSRRGPFLYGFLTQAANPKALVFFTALLPQFIDPGGNVALQVGILGVSSVAIELIVLATYVAGCRVAGSYVRTSRYASLLERVGGGLLVGAGARLAWIRHG